MWGEWGACSVTCGSGKSSRVRECNNPRPDKYGEDCPGSGTEHQNCEEKSCAGKFPSSNNVVNFVLFHCTLLFPVVIIKWEQYLFCKLTDLEV